jgi:peroxiredoxin
MILKSIKLLAVVVLWSHASGFSQESAYRIEVKVENFQGKVCYLGYPYGPKKYLADTAEINSEGKFVFEGPKPLDGGLYFVYSPVPESLYFDLILAEPEFSISTDTTDLIANMKTEGSLENEVFFDFQRFMRAKQKQGAELSEQLKATSDQGKKDELTTKLKELDQEVRSYRSDLFQKYPETFAAAFIRSTVNVDVPEAPKDEQGNDIDPNFAYKYYKEHYFDNIDFSDKKMLRTPNFHVKIEDYLEKMTIKHPDSIISSAHTIIEKARANDEIFRYCVVHITSKYETSNIMGMDAVFVDLSESYYLSGDAFWADSALTAKISDRVARLKPNLLGKHAPSMVLVDTLMRPASLYSLQADYFVLYFYDPDCGHCKKKTPVLKELYDTKLKDMGVKVVATNIKKDVAKWKTYVKEQKLDWINLADPNVMSNFRYEYNLETTPIIYVLDDQKKIIAKKLDVDQLEEFINKQIELKAKNQDAG